MSTENAWDKWRNEIRDKDKQKGDVIKESLKTKDPWLYNVTATYMVEQAEILGLEDIKNKYLTVVDNTERWWNNNIVYSNKLSLSKKRQLFGYLCGKKIDNWFRGINESDDLLKKLSVEIGERWDGYKPKYWLEYIILGEFELAKKLFSERYCEYEIEDDIYYNCWGFRSMIADYFTGSVKKCDMKKAFENLFEKLKKGDDEAFLWDYRGSLENFIRLYYIYYKFILELDESELTSYNVCRSAEKGLLFWRNE